MSSYTPFVWHDGDTGGTLVTAARLNALEQGVAGAAAGGNPFSVKDQYGAAGDGTTDDTAELNAALAAGGLVYLDAGDYKVTGQLYAYSTIRTVFTGPGRIVSTFNDGILRVDNAPHVLDGITILGAGTAQNTQGGIMVDGEGITVTRCTITNVARFGIYSTGSDVRILDNVTDQTSLGTDLQAPSVAAIFNSGDGVRIEGNTCTNTSWGISNRGNSATDPIYDGIIIHNRITMRAGGSAACQGISSAHGRHQKIAFNTIRGYANNCIDQYGAFYSEIIGNTCINGSSDGIFVGHVGTRSITVEGNNIYNCAGSGIRVWDSSTDVNVVGNNIYDLGNSTGAIGIYAAGSINAGETDIADINIIGNLIDGAVTAATGGNNGIVIRHASNVDVSRNTVKGIGRQAIYAETTDVLAMQGNRARDVGWDGTYAAFHTAVGCNRALIDDNVATGASVDIAVRIESGVGHRARGNRWRNVATGVSDTATATVLADNTVF